MSHRISVWTVACMAASLAAAQGTQDLRELAASLELTATQVYELRFSAAGTSVWGPAPGAFGLNECLCTGRQGFGPGRLGGDMHIDAGFTEGHFAAFVDYEAGGEAGLRLRAQVDTGSVDVAYPVKVAIDWPVVLLSSNPIQAGQPVQIATHLYRDPSATLTTRQPQVSAELLAELRADIRLQGDAALVRHIGGFTLLNEHYDNQVKVFDLADFLPNLNGANKQRFDIEEDVAYIDARLPNLVTQGTLGTTDNPYALQSFAADPNFLDATVDITNLITKALFRVPLSGPWEVPLGVTSIRGHRSVLDFRGRMSLGATQELTFAPRVMIRFDVADTTGNLRESKTIAAGKTLTLVMPADGSALDVTPHLFLDGADDFTNHTTLGLEPALEFHPFAVSASGPRLDPPDPFPGIKLPDFSFDPTGGPLRLPLLHSPLDVAAFDSGFKLPGTSVQSPPPAAFRLTPDGSAPVIRSLSPKIVPVDQVAATLTGIGSGFGPNPSFTVNGATVPGTFSGTAFSLTVPAAILARSETLHVQLVRPSVGLQPQQVSNVVDVHVVPEPAPTFDPPQLSQLPGVHSGFAESGCGNEGVPCDVLTEGLAAGHGLLVVGLSSATLDSPAPVEWMSPDSTLLWNGRPVPTRVTPQITTTCEPSGYPPTATGDCPGESPMLHTSYAVFGEIPSSLQDRGGPQRLSFVSGGVLPRETVLEPIVLDYPRPALVEALTLEPERRTSSAATIGQRRARRAGVNLVELAAAPRQAGEDGLARPSQRIAARLALSGSGFTRDTTVQWDGAPRPTRFVSGRQVFVELFSSDLAQPGDHLVTAGNPLPGGGSSAPLVYTIADPGIGQLVAEHDLFRDGHGKIGDVITFRNVGTGPLERLEIRSVKLHVGPGGYSVNLRLPETIRYLPAGDGHSLIGYFPEVGQPGQAAEVRIRGVLNGKPLFLDLPVTLP